MTDADEHCSRACFWPSKYVSTTIQIMIMAAPTKPVPVKTSPSTSQEIAAVRIGSLQVSMDTVVEEIPVRAMFCKAKAKQVQGMAK